MANYRAIAAVGKAISHLIERSCEGGEFSGITCDITHAKVFEHGPVDGFTGFTLLLYRISLKTSNNNCSPRLESDGKRYRPSLPVDLHYLLTPWAKDVETQQRMLGFGMHILEDVSSLPAQFINDCTPERDVFRSQESVEILPENLPLPDYLSLWDKLKPNLQSSMTYLVRTVSIDSEKLLQEGDKVQSRGFNPPAQERSS